jgi:hypothetical protein
MTDTCKHGNEDPCADCAAEAAEHDAVMAVIYGGMITDAHMAPIKHEPEIGDVKRWNNWCCTTHGHSMSESPVGLYVTSADYDALRAELAAAQQSTQGYYNEAATACEQRDAAKRELAALREAAGKVKCWTCHGSGKITWTSGSIMPLGAAPIPCPDCADLRKILGEKHE